LKAKKQNVNGENVFLTLVMEEDMTFMGPNRGWPAFELHAVRMFTPLPLTSPVFAVTGDNVPPKVQIIDDTSHHVNEIEAIKAITIANLNYQLDELDRSGDHQRYDTFLRADYQVATIENYRMNHTSNQIEKVDDTFIKLTNMVFLSRARSDTGDGKENLGVACIATNEVGEKSVIHVWSNALMGSADRPSYTDLEMQLEEKSKQYDDLLKQQQGDKKGGKGKVSTLDWILVFMLMSLVVGIIVKQLRNVNKMTAGATAVEYGAAAKSYTDEEGGVEMKGGGNGLDMRPIDGAITTTNDDKFDAVQL